MDFLQKVYDRLKALGQDKTSSEYKKSMTAYKQYVEKYLPTNWYKAVQEAWKKQNPKNADDVS